MGKDLKGKELGPNIGQRKNGAYYGRYLDLNGDRKMIYDDSLRSLRSRLKELEFQIEADRNAPPVLKPQITLNEWFEQWMDIYKDSVRENTKRHYAQIYRKHIAPALGSMPLISITDADITKLINELKRKGYQFETKNKVKILLVDMYSRAILNRIASENPARSVRVFKDKTVERRVLTQEEQTDFFDTCKGTFYDELFTVAILTGLRPGELCALRWKDIDLKNKCLRVERTLIYQKFEGEEKKTFHAGPPKTRESNRTVYFNERCATALKKQFSKRSMISLRTAYDPIPGFEDLLFVTKYGTPINASIYGSAIERIIDLINENRCDGIDTFEKFSPHCFRHTYATRCFEANVAPKIVQEQLGHASLKMTMDLYTHVTETKRLEELEKFSVLTEMTFEAADKVAEYRFKEQQKIRSIV